MNTLSRFQIFQIEPVENHKLDRMLENIRDEIISDGFVILPERIMIDPVQVNDRDVFKQLTDLSRHITLIAGSMLIKDQNSIYNRSYVFNHGRLVGYQDKIVPFAREKSRLSPGRVLKVFTVNGLTFTVAVCYDIDFPFYAKLSAINGARMIFNPSLIRSDFHQEWHTYIKTRSLENRINIVSVNSRHELFKGDSLSVSPYIESDAVRLEIEEYGLKHSAILNTELKDVDDKYRSRIAEDPGVYSFPVKKVIDR